MVIRLKEFAFDLELSEPARKALLEDHGHDNGLYTLPK